MIKELEDLNKEIYMLDNSIKKFQKNVTEMLTELSEIRFSLAKIQLKINGLMVDMVDDGK